MVLVVRLQQAHCRQQQRLHPHAYGFCRHAPRSARTRLLVVSPAKGFGNNGSNKNSRAQPSPKPVPDQQQAAFQAAALIDEMVKETFDKLFVSSSARYLLEGSAERSDDEPNELTEILSDVVSPRLDSMPSIVVPMLDSYLLALTTDQGATSNDDIVKVLVLLKEQILEQVERKMPESVRRLQACVDAADREARARVYEEVSSSSSSSSPSPSADELLDAACRLLDQLEDDPQLDTRLLCKLVVIRSELRNRSADGQEKNRFAQLGSIPQAELDRIEKLLATVGPERSKALEAICEAEDGRPGLLCDCLAVLRAESVESANVSAHALVELERELLEVCEQLSASMTLPTTKAWKKDGAEEDGYLP